MALYVQNPVPSHLFDICLHQKGRHQSQVLTQKCSKVGKGGRSSFACSSQLTGSRGLSVRDPLLVQLPEKELCQKGQPLSLKARGSSRIEYFPYPEVGNREAQVWLAVMIALFEVCRHGKIREILRILVRFQDKCFERRLEA